MSKDAPKSAVELVMARLERQEASLGEVSPLTAAQKEAIAACRRDYDAKVAEAEILFRSARVATVDPDARLQLEANHRRDLGQFTSSRDKAIDTIRKGSQPS